MRLTPLSLALLPSRSSLTLRSPSTRSVARQWSAPLDPRGRTASCKWRLVLLAPPTRSIDAPRKSKTTEATPQQVYEALGKRSVDPVLAERAQVLADALTLGPQTALKLAQMEAQGEPIPSSLLAKAASTGEIGADPFALAAARDLNARLARSATPGVDSPETFTAPEALERAAIEQLDDDTLARVAAQVQERLSGTPAQPYRQLSGEETRLIANELGLGPTSGGRRNSFRKEKTASNEAAVLKTPGNVLSAGMEFPQSDVLLPILVAPKSEQRYDVSDPNSEAAWQVPQYNTGRRNPKTGKAVFAPALKDARVLYVNPYAELPSAVVDELGLERVAMQLEKDQSGGYDQAAINVPVPDVGQGAYGFEPRYDPAFGAKSAPTLRNPTFAEAVKSIALRNTTRIRPVTEEMLGSGGSRYDDVLFPSATSNDPVGDVYALGGKRVRNSQGEQVSAPISSYLQQPADPSAPRVADVRVGSGQKYTPQFFTELDDLVDALAGRVYGRSSAAQPITQQVATDERYRPALASALPGNVRYGALLNLPSTDPVVADFQRQLLAESGFPLEGRRATGANPLIGLVETLQELGGAPVSETPIRQVALSAAEAEPLLATDNGPTAARQLQQAKNPIFSGRAASQPTTDSSRQVAERAASDFLRRKVAEAQQVQAEKAANAPTPQSMRDPRQMVIPGLRRALRSARSGAAGPGAASVDAPIPVSAARAASSVQPPIPGIPGLDTWLMR
jgi:hypothetical protein